MCSNFLLAKSQCKSTQIYASQWKSVHGRVVAKQNARLKLVQTDLHRHASPFGESLRVLAAVIPHVLSATRLLLVL